MADPHIHKRLARKRIIAIPYLLICLMYGVGQDVDNTTVIHALHWITNLVWGFVLVGCWLDLYFEYTSNTELRGNVQSPMYLNPRLITEFFIGLVGFLTFYFCARELYEAKTHGLIEAHIMVIGLSTVASVLINFILAVFYAILNPDKDQYRHPYILSCTYLCAAGLSGLLYFSINKDILNVGAGALLINLFFVIIAPNLMIGALRDSAIRVNRTERAFTNSNLERQQLTSYEVEQEEQLAGTQITSDTQERAITSDNALVKLSKPATTRKLNLD